MMENEDNTANYGDDSMGFEIDAGTRSQEQGRFCEAIDEQRLAMGLASSLPIELEIGSGKGLFLIRAAKENPNRTFIGMELATKYAREAQEKLEKENSTNAVFLACDAVALMAQDVPDSSVVAVHVYFPDPWWKARHRKRRVLSDEFLRHAGRALVTGGELHVWTDVEEYFREALDAAATTGLYATPRKEEAGEPRHDLDYRTHFERRTRLAGDPVWRAALTRNNTAAGCTRQDVPTVPR